METPDTVYISAEKARNFVIDVLTKYQVTYERSELVAHALVLADLRGVDTHGINRLPIYCDRLRKGLVTPNPNLQFTHKTPVMASLDGQNTLGFIVGSVAIDECIRMAETFGVGIVSCKHSSHYGMAATYLLQAIDKGFAAIALTNASRSMPPWGGSEALLGTSPFAVGFPGGSNGHFILDMSPAVAAKGKIRKAARRGEHIPLGYALDETGKETTDAAAALKGVVLPIGGPKGSGLAMMMDLFGGVISGAAFAGDVQDQYKVAAPQDVGHWFMAFNPDIFLESRGEYIQRLDELIARVRQCPKAFGVSQIFTPGEIEASESLKRRRDGIPILAAEIETLEKLARECGSNVTLR